MAVTVAVALQKGGVGKTTICRHIGHCIAAQGLRCLMIDLDPQGSLTDIATPAQEAPPATVATMADVMGANEAGTGDLLPIIRSVSPGLDLAPSGIGLSLTESALILRRAREYILQRATEGIAGNYDYILIDCPPAFGLLLTNAIMAADWVVMPVLLDAMSLGSAGLFLRTLADMQADYPQAAARLLGSVANRANIYTVLGRDMLSAMRGRADLMLFDAIIPATVKIEEAALLKTTINDYEPQSAAAVAFDELTKELIARGKQT